MKIRKKFGGLARRQKLKSNLNVIKSNEDENILLSIEREKSGETSCDEARVVYVELVFEGKRINGYKETEGNPKKRRV